VADNSPWYIFLWHCNVNVVSVFVSNSLFSVTRATTLRSVNAKTLYTSIKGLKHVKRYEGVFLRPAILFGNFKIISLYVI